MHQGTWVALLIVLLSMGGIARASLECEDRNPSTHASHGPTLRIKPGKRFSLRRGAGARLGDNADWEMRFLGVDADLRCHAPPPASCAVDGAAIVRVRVTRTKESSEICFRISNHPEDKNVFDTIYRDGRVRLELKSLKRVAEFEVTRE